jgi:putative ABC transport system permease protein
MVGRNFNPDRESDRKGMLINEEASKMFGFEGVDEALGKIIFVGSRSFEIIGVIENYHFRSLRYKLRPILFMQGYPRNPAYAIKVSKENMTNTISMIEEKWKETYPGNVFSYYFLDEKFDQQYSSDKQIGMVTSVLTILAVIISFLGLFGLSLYNVNRRIREIGIRKVLGASVSNVIVLLSKEHIVLVMTGCGVGVSLVYQMIKTWLQNYAYKMPLDFALFLIPILIVVLLSTLTVSIKTVRASLANPVDSLKSE